MVTKNLIAAFDDWYELGSYNFANGDTVTVTDNGKTAVIGSLKTESANPIFLNADSLDVVELLMSIEDEFEVEIPDEEIENIKTIGELVEYIQSNT